MRFLMGVDGGGSSTRAVVVTPESWKILGRGTAGSSNHYSVGARGAAENCQLAVQRALADARLDHPEISTEAISSWGFALAGVRRERDALVMGEQIGKWLQNAKWTLETDAIGAHNGAFMGKPGIMLSVGTGAICLGMNEKDERFYADGWGPILGDLGSGYWIGLEALRAACRQQDAEAMLFSELSKVLLARLKLENWDALVHWIYAPETSRDQVARLSQAVFELANCGEENAIEIQREAASHLAETVFLVAQRMQQVPQKSTSAGSTAALDSSKLPIVLRGGVFADKAFKRLVARTIEERIARLNEKNRSAKRFISQPRFDADIGAAFCAQKLLTLC